MERLSARIRHLFGRLDPSAHINRLERYKGLGWLVRNGVAAQVMETLAVGPLLVAFAVERGASNLYIGLIASIPHLAQLMQFPGVWLVERYRKRRLISVLSAGASRPALLLLALAALWPSPQAGLALLLIGLILRYGVAGLVSSSWNSWMRDLVPESRLGRFFALRLALMTVAGTGFSLLAAGMIDGWGRWIDAPVRFAYAILFCGAFVAGCYSVYCMARMPEPAMPPRERSLNYRELLTLPFRDANFRRLIWFLGSWNFAVNLAAPFFTVHMLRRLDLGVTVVLALTVVSQLANIFVLRRWGMIADRFANKSVLNVAGPLFIACIFAWILTTRPELAAFTLPLLVLIHILTGIATAGVTLASGNIALKLAPRGEATAYLSTVSIANALAAGIAPVIGGLLADFFVERQLQLFVRWWAPGETVSFEALTIRQWDFFFLLAGLIGMYSLHRLALVREVGEAREDIVLHELLLDAKRTVRNLSSIAGLRSATEFPLEMLRRNLYRRGRARRRDGDATGRPAAGGTAPESAAGTGADGHPTDERQPEGP